MSQIAPYTSERGEAVRARHQMTQTGNGGAVRALMRPRRGGRGGGPRPMAGGSAAVWAGGSAAACWIAVRWSSPSDDAVTAVPIGRSTQPNGQDPAGWQGVDSVREAPATQATGGGDARCVERRRSMGGGRPRGLNRAGAVTEWAWRRGRCRLRDATSRARASVTSYAPLAVAARSSVQECGGRSGRIPPAGRGVLGAGGCLRTPCPWPNCGTRRSGAGPVQCAQERARGSSLCWRPTREGRRGLGVTCGCQRCQCGPLGCQGAEALRMAGAPGSPTVRQHSAWRRGRRVGRAGRPRRGGRMDRRAAG